MKLYTPYIFRYGRIKWIPIEAVAVVVECKSEYSKEESLEKWAERIAELETSVEVLYQSSKQNYC